MSCLLQLRELLVGHVRPAGGLRRDPVHGAAQRRCVSALGGNAAQLQQRGDIIRPSLEDLLDQALEFGFAVGAALPLDFKGELIQSTNVLRIVTDGIAKVGNGRGGIASGAFEGAEVSLDAPIVRSEGMRAVEPLLRLIIVALADGENAPIRPCRGFARRLLGGRRKGVFRAHIVADFHRGQADVEGLHELRVLGRLRLRQARATADEAYQ